MKPCTKCDSTERNEIGQCLPCKREANRKYRRLNSEKVRETNSGYYGRNRETVIESARKYRQMNSEKVRAAVRTSHQKYGARYVDSQRACCAKRRAVLKTARCTCCTDKQVADAYWLSSEFGEMDHKTPLALGGLHCRFNLQLLTVKQHKIKTAADMAAIAQARKSQRVLR